MGIHVNIKAIRCSILLLLCCIVEIGYTNLCDNKDRDLFITDIKKPCQPGQGLFNLLHMDGAYCYNDGSGKCKAFSGKFEYYFNTRTQEFLGPVESSTFVDSRGYHERVPVSYDINGNIIYADRSINWSRQYVTSTLQGKKIALLSINSFNWCGFVQKGWWPYKSSIKDPEGKYEIYFFNRQSCIIKDDEKQHYNTRFLHKSKIRLDLDINPTIFAMEDHLAGNEIRLVKHRRQHWYEVKFKVVENPTNDIRFFVEMDDTETLPSLINSTSGPILNKAMLEKKTDICLNDCYQTRTNGKNSQLVPSYSGHDSVEIADLPWPEKFWLEHERSSHTKGNPIHEPYEVHLHGIPRYTESNEQFYGVNVRKDADWEEFARDNHTFSATTTYPTYDPYVVNVISLYSIYKEAQDKYDEYYPMPHMAIYQARSYPVWSDRGQIILRWEISDRKRKEKAVKNLNYVDDIAYLHKCKSVLIIFGPLYTEMLASEFDIDKETTIGSIYDLGIWEPAFAFMAQEGTDTLWVYHQLNYVAQHTYTCGSNGSLVTAVKARERYFYRIAPPESMAPIFLRRFDVRRSHSAESHFKLMGLFKGEVVPEAPDPDRYPLGLIDMGEPLSGADNTWLYIIVIIGVLVLLSLCIICLATIRRRHKKGQAPFSFFGLFPTIRSALTSRPRDSASTVRSGAITNRPHSLTPTMRSQERSRSASKRPSRTVRSGALYTHDSSDSSRVPSARSILKKTGPGSQRSKSGSYRKTVRSQPVLTQHSSRGTLGGKITVRSGVLSQGSNQSGSSKKPTVGI